MTSNSPRSANRTLIIDDDPLVQDFVRTVLATLGFEVVAVATGEAGIEFAKAHGPALVIVDMRLPGLQGLDVIKALFRLPVPPPTIVGLSAAWAETEHRAIDLGAAAFLRKPLSPQSLVKTVEGALGGKFVWIDD